MNFKGNWQSFILRKRYLKSLRRLDIHNFKRDEYYKRVVGNDMRNFEKTLDFYEHLKANCPKILNSYNIFSVNDIYGNPNLFHINGNNYSPGTLRYMTVLSEIDNLKLMDNIKNVIEIGGGYGGQALIFSIFFKKINYDIIDIPQVNLLIHKYLKKTNPSFEFNLHSINKIEIEKEIISNSLIISDYCISELDKKGIDFYLNNILLHAKSCYITINSKGEIREYLVNHLKNIFPSFKITDEKPVTNSNHISNIVFSGKKF